MSDQPKSTSQSTAPGDDLRHCLLDDVTVGDLAAILGISLEDYVDRVVGFWGDAAAQPLVRVVDSEALKQQGYYLDVAPLADLAEWLEQVVTGAVALRPLTGGSFPGAAIASARRKARWITGGDMQTAAPVVSAPPRGSIEADNSEIGRAVKDQVARATTMARTQRATMPPLPKGQPKAAPAAADAGPGRRVASKNAVQPVPPAHNPRVKPPIKQPGKPGSTTAPRQTANRSDSGRDDKFKDDPGARLKDRLVQLKEAFDSGLLTQAEYARKKREVMRSFGEE